MDKKSGMMLVLFTAIVSGFSIFINKFGVEGVDSGVFTFTKNIIVSFVIVSIILLFKSYKELIYLKKSDWVKLILIGFLGGSIPFLLFFRGLQLTSSAGAALIHKSMFVFVIIFAFIFLKERVNKNIIIGAGLLFVGNFLILKINDFGFNYGSLLILIATLFWAIENTLSKYTLRNLSGNVVIFGRMFFGSLFILFYLIFGNKLNLILALDTSQIYWILISTGFLFLYVFSWYNGLKYINVSVASCILLLGSVITTSLNYIFSGVSVTLVQAVGMFLLLNGIIFIIGISEFSDLLKYIFSKRGTIKWKT